MLRMTPFALHQRQLRLVNKLLVRLEIGKQRVDARMAAIRAMTCENYEPSLVDIVILVRHDGANYTLTEKA